VEADAGGKDSGGAAGIELLGIDELGQGWEDDDFELSCGAGQAGTVECGAAVSVSGGFSNPRDTECAEYNGSRCSAGPEERSAAVSVSGRAASGHVRSVLFILFESG